jgi:hypothetical protein
VLKWVKQFRAVFDDFRVVLNHFGIILHDYEAFLRDFCRFQKALFPFCARGRPTSGHHPKGALRA